MAKKDVLIIPVESLAQTLIVNIMKDRYSIWSLLFYSLSLFISLLWIDIYLGLGVSLFNNLYCIRLIELGISCCFIHLVMYLMCESYQYAFSLQSSEVYELFSVMIHSGNALGGHYYAYIK